MVTAATPDIEPAWLEQLTAGGIVLAPLTLAPGLAFVVRGTGGRRHLRRPPDAGGVFHAAARRGGDGRWRILDRPFFREVPCGSMRAPWAGWFDRKRRRLRWLGIQPGHCLLRLAPRPGRSLPNPARMVRACLASAIRTWARCAGSATRNGTSTAWPGAIWAGPCGGPFWMPAAPGRPSSPCAFVPPGACMPQRPEGYVRQGSALPAGMGADRATERPAWL